MSNAAQFYKAALSVTTGLSAPFSNLAMIYKQQVAKISFFRSCYTVCIYKCITNVHVHANNNMALACTSLPTLALQSCYKVNNVLKG